MNQLVAANAGWRWGWGVEGAAGGACIRRLGRLAGNACKKRSLTRGGDGAARGPVGQVVVELAVDELGGAGGQNIHRATIAACSGAKRECVCVCW